MAEQSIQPQAEAPTKTFKRKKKCAFFTDCEGNLDYFEKYVSMSKIIRFESAGVLDFYDLDTIFVYGGDSQDKGIGDIRFVKMLLAFKKRYPSRVEFIIGNRDGNKIRLCSELNIDLSDEKMTDLYNKACTARIKLHRLKIKSMRVNKFIPCQLFHHKDITFNCQN